jgi:hypothetical protein
MAIACISWNSVAGEDKSRSKGIVCILWSSVAGEHKSRSMAIACISRNSVSGEDISHVVRILPAFHGTALLEKITVT